MPKRSDYEILNKNVQEKRFEQRKNTRQILIKFFKKFFYEIKLVNKNLSQKLGLKIFLIALREIAMPQKRINGKN